MKTWLSIIQDILNLRLFHYKDNNMNSLDDEIKHDKIIPTIIDIVVLSVLAYALYTYVYPTLVPYL
jgi:hypothetical protein